MRAFLRMAIALIGAVRAGDAWEDVLDLGCDCQELDDWQGEWA